MLRAIFLWLFLAIASPALAQQPPPQPGLAGIGAVLVDKKGAPVVNEVLPHSPAAIAGIKPQDTIVWVDYRDVSGMKLADVVNLIRGESGTSVAITVTHPGRSKPETFTLKRAPITFQP